MGRTFCWWTFLVSAKITTYAEDSDPPGWCLRIYTQPASRGCRTLAGWWGGLVKRPAPPGAREPRLNPAPLRTTCGQVDSSVYI
eukprot:8829867-Pyramimonas_sp.AAC.1